jgi:aminoacrylate hydrolase
MAVRRQWYPSDSGFTAQLQGILHWEAYSRLPQIAARTLVVHGDSDRLIPPANGELIAKSIRTARLVLIPKAGHIFSTDQPAATDREVLEFLAFAGASSSIGHQ